MSIRTQNSSGEGKPSPDGGGVPTGLGSPSSAAPHTHTHTQLPKPKVPSSHRQTQMQSFARLRCEIASCALAVLAWVPQYAGYHPHMVRTERPRLERVLYPVRTARETLGASRPVPPVRTQRGRPVRVARTYPTEAPGRTCQLSPRLHRLVEALRLVRVRARDRNTFGLRLGLGPGSGLG